MSRVHRLLLAAAEQDRTFEKQEVRGELMWVGRCIHCRKRITVPLSPGEPASATLEHIVPRSHGGGDELANLALACGPCNHAKGHSVDCLCSDAPALQQMIAYLRRERDARTRR